MQEEDIFTIAGLTGQSPFTLLENVHRPSFTFGVGGNAELDCLNATYVADPFVIVVEEKEYLFYELLLKDEQKGVIAIAERVLGQKYWNDCTIVIEEPFHLSYPMLFKDGQNLYMTVESATANEVRVYKSVHNIRSWLFVESILKGSHYDPTIFQYEGVWYMFTCVDLTSTTFLYYSISGLFGQWCKHPKAPIVKNNASMARPAGPILQWNAKQYRLAQDCSERYGASVKAFEITALSPSEYAEKEVGVILTGQSIGWNSHGMHHLQIYQSAHGLVHAVCDGYTRRRVL